jgi:hypothetical protein
MPRSMTIGGIYVYRFHGWVRGCPGGSEDALVQVDGDMPTRGDTDGANGFLAGRLAEVPRSAQPRFASSPLTLVGNTGRSLKSQLSLDFRMSLRVDFTCRHQGRSANVRCQEASDG